jgi:hypothetical protein
VVLTGWAPEVVLNGLAPEVVLTGWAPEVVLTGWAPEVVLIGWAPEVVITLRSRNNFLIFFYFNTLYHASFIILHYDQQMHNYSTNYHTATCFDTVVSSSDSL